MSKGATVKRTLIAILAINVVLGPTAFAEAKGKAQNVVALKCAPTKATGHSPKDVAPAQKLPKKLVRTFTFETNCGNIVVTTVGAKAPITITQLATLAKGGYFNNSLCHRLTTQGLYVLQCGDPTATGGGGPRFTYGDENLPVATINNYPAGTVAMANSGPGTNGSQFFLVFADTTLGANYTIWGTITQGLDIVKAIASAGVKGGGADGTPNQTIAITRVTVSN
ncbi:MAG: peptidylprolyl isomerase [Actinobacteria bacterium]|jgi:peptidyl-prolyl cis-trans isomerase B (cyclophilin B)|nr:peptidylprolyl isomerase [Actinomycetota bacterium]